MGNAVCIYNTNTFNPLIFMTKMRDKWIDKLYQW